MSGTGGMVHGHSNAYAYSHTKFDAAPSFLPPPAHYLPPVLYHRTAVNVPEEKRNPPYQHHREQEMNMPYFMQPTSSVPHTDLDGNSVRLTMRQQPERALVVTDNKERNRKPVDPAPIVRMEVMDERSGDDHWLVSPHLFMMVTLVQESQDGALVPAKGKTIIGTGSSSLHRLKDLDNNDGGYFIFGDISIQQAGHFRLKFNLFNLVKESNEVQYVSSIISKQFEVTTSKSFPGLGPSTTLSRQFADQGVRLRVRKETRSKRESQFQIPQTAGQKRGRDEEDHYNVGSPEAKITRFTSQPRSHYPAYGVYPGTQMMAPQSSHHGHMYSQGIPRFDQPAQVAHTGHAAPAAPAVVPQYSMQQSHLQQYDHPQISYGGVSGYVPSTPARSSASEPRSMSIPASHSSATLSNAPEVSNPHSTPNGAVAHGPINHYWGVSYAYPSDVAPVSQPGSMMGDSNNTAWQQGMLGGQPGGFDMPVSGESSYPGLYGTQTQY